MAKKHISARKALTSQNVSPNLGEGLLEFVFELGGPSAFALGKLSGKLRWNEAFGASEFRRRA
jgi:hypothetical protein